MNNDDKELFGKLNATEKSELGVITEFFNRDTGLVWRFNRNGNGSYDGKSGLHTVRNITTNSMHRIASYVNDSIMMEIDRWEAGER